ncbi:MAG: ATP-grasp domain-containing protein [Gammaproteobacteria bacterium]|nr:ATP-grasp domain-containing protein [Gammaproteobacteria bacterium]NIR25819.1 ATP-grasp domain-containing protein [Gammaproteobacteria bacterium]NIV71075.1 ATP-grasp domain-containing protein [Phycisphaerae bacterium]NIY20789.1 ATP-grasp domain-containing protein [Gammaproteobacteria bacterium]
MPDLIEEGCQKISNFKDSIDAVVCYWDFPATLLLPIFRQAAGLPTTSLESILRCEHKYWSRLIQSNVVHELVPKAVAFDPLSDDSLAQIELDYPFWIKPVKAHSSILGFRIERKEDFDRALPQIRSRIGRIAEPFNFIFNQVDVPPEIARINGNYFVAEEIISASYQCTLEGYVFNGETFVYGAVDSLREKNLSSLTRYHYPSRLPRNVLEEMVTITKQVMPATGLNNEPFNIEFFYDPDTERITLLEINPRISKSHCPLFYFVEGASHQEVMVELALGKKPNYPHGKGRFPMAAKYMVRSFSGDAVVKRVPNRDEITAAQNEIDGVLVVLWVKEGDKLSHFADTDSYSFEYANIFIGGMNEADLIDKYRRTMQKLSFEFEPMSDQEH